MKRVNKIPLGKRDLNTNTNVSRSSSRSKQLSAKNRLVYKKDTIKTINGSNIKSDAPSGVSHTNGTSKIENKENDFMQINTNVKLNRTSSGRENQKNIKSMSGMRKLYTLKANNSSRRLESQSYRDLTHKTKKYEPSSKNTRIMQNSLNIYNTSMASKRHGKNKASASETPKLRSQNEALFTGIKGKAK